MELKRYQRRVLRDIEEFIDRCNAARNIREAFRLFWSGKGIELTEGTELRPYQSSIPGVPRVTVKVPTAGGKTFIACNALEKIFSTLGIEKPKVVIWFVPSDPILQQTILRLKDPSDPYRQRIDSHFNGAVKVYDKEELLRATNFNPVTIKEQLTIAVLSIDSFATTEKEARRVRRENENLKEFGHENYLGYVSLMEVLASLHPVVIIDESHNFRSNLRVETLRDINPSFILELTATPRESSNIISYVDAKQLKDEHMVKLPVIVYNNRCRQDVLTNSINLRDNLESMAVEAEHKEGRYIRPIVLFQAQPRTSHDSETFDKIKNHLIEAGIPEEQIKIKTAEKDELRNVNLMSRDCPVRYIITVNALKEGWDCPFAYILASLANRTSKVDVEQILGRILRLPYSSESENEFLNMGYVFTSSFDFQQTITSIIEGLQCSGFSAKDYRAAEITEGASNERNNHTIHSNLFDISAEPLSDIEPDDAIDPKLIRRSLNVIAKDNENKAITNILNMASHMNGDFSRKMEEEMNEHSPLPLPPKAKATNEVCMKPALERSGRKISLPVFEIKKQVTNKVLFQNADSSHIWVRLEKEHLYQGFDISLQDKNIVFNWTASSAVKVDLEERHNDEFVPKAWTLDSRQITEFKNYIGSLAPQGKVNQLAAKIAQSMHGTDTIPYPCLVEYVKDVISNIDSEKFGQLTDNIGTVIELFNEKIKSLLKDYASIQFEKLLDEQEIRSNSSYNLPKVINPGPIDRHGLSKSLYTEEGVMNDFEAEIIRQVSSLDNVEFWHRNLERGKGFFINGNIHHYPDFIIKLKSGKIVLLETKGDDRDNSDSREKLKLGNIWAHESGKNYRYYIVFKHSDKLDGALTCAQLIERIGRL